MQLIKLGLIICTLSNAIHAMEFDTDQNNNETNYFNLLPKEIIRIIAYKLLIQTDKLFEDNCKIPVRITSNCKALKWYDREVLFKNLRSFLFICKPFAKAGRELFVNNDYILENLSVYYTKNLSSSPKIHSAAQLNSIIWAGKSFRTKSRFSS